VKWSTPVSARGPISWDISPDGKRFLIISDKSQENSSLNVILNWRPQEEK
jgi:hypothetical protein